jgi:hypothetical protein
MPRQVASVVRGSVWPQRRIAQEAAAKCLAELREDELGPEQVQAAARNLGPSRRWARNSSAAARCSLMKSTQECNPMMREIALFGAGVPSVLLYFISWRRSRYSSRLISCR